MTAAGLECGRGRPFANTAALALAIVSAVIGGLTLASAADARYGDGVLKVLVMGDSYSAGNGAGSYEGPRGCRRSPGHNYGGTFTQLVSQRPYGQQAEVTVVACSGATTSAFASNQGDRDPQLDAVTPDADVVFLTIGGNDLKFASIVQYCLIAKTRDGANCGPLLTRAEDGLRSGVLEGRLTRLLTAIGARTASGVRIVLLGYPYLEGDPDYSLRSGHFGHTFIQVGRRLRALQALGDRVQQRAVDAADAKSDATILFEPTKRLFNGPPNHTLFAKKNNSDRWFIQPFVDATTASRDTWYHPNVLGWAAEGGLLLNDRRIPSYDAGLGERRFPAQLYGGEIELRYSPPSVMPTYIKFGSGQTLGIDRWDHWGDDVATGHGLYVNHGDDRSTASVVLSKPQQCGAYQLYTLAQFSYNTPDPSVDFPRPDSIPLRVSC